MIELVFLVCWTLVMVLAAAAAMVFMKRHAKVYVVMGCSFVYVSVVFAVFPYLRGLIG